MGLFPPCDRQRLWLVDYPGESPFSVSASKVVNGQEVVMGTSEWKYDEKKQVVECERPSIQLQVSGNKMQGALKLNDGTVYRRIYLKKES